MSQHRTLTLDLAEPDFVRLEAEAKKGRRSHGSPRPHPDPASCWPSAKRSPAGAGSTPTAARNAAGGRRGRDRAEGASALDTQSGSSRVIFMSLSVVS